MSTNIAEIIVPLTIGELLHDPAQYMVPVYQRNYAWGEGEIMQLVQDIIDVLRKKQNQNYYIGTLVVYGDYSNNKIVYHTIDGQQRLTTLTMLTAVLKNNKELISGSIPNVAPNLSFESRTASTATIFAAFEGNLSHLHNPHPSLEQAYAIIEQILRNKLTGSNAEATPQEFIDFLYNRVQIIRVQVPEDTDLNHYFEIMNSRGEQLEKHEVLKAKLLAVIENDNTLTSIDKLRYSHGFNTIWETCANMEKYVQHGFSPAERHKLFGLNNWSEFKVNNFDEVVDILGADPKGGTERKLTIDEILTGSKQPKDKKEAKLNQHDQDAPDRFDSVINFPNFLLQVLLVMTKDKEVTLDDKQLLPAFEGQIKKGKVKFVKEFAYSLLRAKYLFDHYIIKREQTNNKESWSLQKMNWSNDKYYYSQTFGNENNNEGSGSKLNYNHIALMLLAMFHVSNPSMAYKYWLNAALKHLFHSGPITERSYIGYLRKTARAFVYGRFLAKKPKEYYDMIYSSMPESFSFHQIDKSKLRYGYIENNLVFNYLDYLLWRSDRKAFSDFEYTQRSSVEHFYPRHPINGKPIDEEIADMLGNLCLISPSQNSSLNNHLPETKTKLYFETHQDKVISPKLHVMMKNGHDWSEKAIKAHNAKMLEIFKNDIEL